MAGHSKWANIKHKKAAQDAKRGKIFTKLIREITVSARLSGADINANPRLRAAIQTALSNNMTKDTIERAVKKGSGNEDNSNVEELRYEGYIACGVAILVDCITDNKNRTIAEVRSIFNKANASLGMSGSVSYMFKKLGIIEFDKDTDEESLFENALENDALDIINNNDGSFTVLTSFENFSNIKDILDSKNLKSIDAKISMEADIKVDITTKEDAFKIINFVDKLEDLDDVQNVWINANISDEILEDL